MRKVVDISIDEVKPDRPEVLKNQGILPEEKISERIEKLLMEATDLFIELCEPRGVLSEIALPEFEVVYAGEGLNEPSTPLEGVVKKADSMALFAVTIGESVSQKMDELFRADDFALGSMLDSVASVGTEKVAYVVESHFVEWLSEHNRMSSSTGVLIYSPGYCGWHVSGQKKLFEFLHPEEIGIDLLDSFVMIPLKSMSGVIVAGKREIHYIKDTYPFCRECKTHSCRDRIRLLRRSGRR